MEQHYSAETGGSDLAMHLLPWEQIMAKYHKPE